VILQPIDWWIIGGYLVFAIGVGAWLARRAGRSTQDFYLANRSLPWWVAGTSMVATSFAADTPLVVTGWVRSAGISQNWLWWGMASGGSLAIIVIAGWWRRLKVTTDAEFIEQRYAGKQAKALRAFLGGYHSTVTNTITLIWVLVAMKKVVRVVLDLPDDSMDGPIVAGGLVLALTYSFLSGLWGVVVTDFFQFILAMAGALFLAFQASEALGGLDAARESFAQLGHATTSIMPTQGGGWNDLLWWTQGIGAFLIFLGVQGWLNKNADGGGAAVQRYSACKDPEHARKASLWFHIAHYALRPWPWIFVALASMTLIPAESLPMLTDSAGNITGPDHEAAYPMMMAQLLGPGLFGLMCASFLAAFMSTLDTHFNLASAYFVNDLYRRFLNKTAAPKHYVWVGRFAEVGIALLAGGLALVADSISDLFTFSLSLLGGLGPALLLRWFWWRANAWTEISALATSTAMTLILGTFFGAIPYPVSYAIVLGTSIVVMLVTTLLTAPTPNATLENFYGRVKPAGAWRPFRKPGDPNTLAPLLVGWFGGTALIYGLLFGIGHWMLGNSSLLWWLTALVGGILLRISWHPAFPKPDFQETKS
jgi:Na+/proline symporter